MDGRGMPEPSMGIAGTELVSASHIPGEAIQANDRAEQQALMHAPR